MTRPRSTYFYGSQSVLSDSAQFRIVHDADERTLSLLHEDAVSWCVPLTLSLKQVFVSDDGLCATLDAADTLAMRGRDGQLVGQASLLDLACGNWRTGEVAGSSVQHSSAGPIWEDFLAASFERFDSLNLFVASGRGESTLVIDPATMSRVPVNPDAVHRALRSRAPRRLSAAVNAMRDRPTSKHPFFHGEPWRLAAVGWARVAGETDARNAVPHLKSLAVQPMHVDGMTWLGWYPQPRDAIKVNRYALDPLRQATLIALLRLGAAPPPVPAVQLARRESWFRTRWLELPVPEDLTTALQDVSSGATPSELVDRVGPPTHVAQEDGRVAWSYDFQSADGGRTTEVRWSRTGADIVTEAGPIPTASPGGRVA